MYKPTTGYEWERNRRRALRALDHVLDSDPAEGSGYYDKPTALPAIDNGSTTKWMDNVTLGEAIDLWGASTKACAVWPFDRLGHWIERNHHISLDSPVRVGIRRGGMGKGGNAYMIDVGDRTFIDMDGLIFEKGQEK